VLGAAIKAVVELASALDGESHRSTAEKKFSLLYRMARYIIFKVNVVRSFQPDRKQSQVNLI